MKVAYEKRLFIKMWCGGKTVGWCLLTGWHTQTLGQITDNDLEREGTVEKQEKCIWTRNLTGWL